MNDLLIEGLRAEETLLSDSSNNELLIINLATVSAEGILIPVLHKCVAVGCKWVDHLFDCSFRTEKFFL